MQRHPEYTRNRIAHVVDQVRSLIYPASRPFDELLVSGPTDRISFDAAQALPEWRTAQLGDEYGPPWATFWFRAAATVPPEWRGRRVDLQWVTHGEATLWLNGRSAQGLNWTAGDRPDAVLLEKAKGGDALAFQIEMACNGKFGQRGKERFENVSPYLLDKAVISVFDADAWQIYWDLFVLKELEKQMNLEGGTAERAWAGELLFELNRFCNAFDPSDRDSWAEARAILKPLYGTRNATRTHELSAIGHAHIDTAWLWPLAETDRKCTRTFSTATAYLDAYPEYKFSCSQAYQYARMKSLNPDLYARMRRAIKKGQFVPVGGTWIEPDCNIPSGESLCRQFLFGQRYFEREFGVRCKEFWNPDVFGYNGQLPQIMNQAGIKRFLTQKLSWNAFNKPHHHTFTWQGIDGSEVLAHFPPTDTYNADARIDELRKHSRDYKDHAYGRHSYMLFGYGDGGGGPTKGMLETLRRAKDLQGLPRTTIRSSDEFFDLLEADLAERPLLIGELYFELHRGTYTTQAATKHGNRKSELLLHDVEFLSAIAAKRHGHAYPREAVNALWETVLLNQFHDILPGSSITLVYDDARRDYALVKAKGEALRDAALNAIARATTNPTPAATPARAAGVTPVNTTGFARAEVATLPDGSLGFVEAPGYGTGRVAEATDAVTVRRDKGTFVLENAHLRAELSAAGQLVGLVDKATGREAMAGPGDFKLYDDDPVKWEAWDIEPQAQETERDLPPAESASVVAHGGLRGEVLFVRKAGRNSTIRQTVRLDAGARRLEFHNDVHWDESRKMLKVAFPVNVRAMNATYEMQFGTVERPTHYNTNHDLAMFEVPGHKWSDLSEHGFGVALLSESKYGYSTFGNTMRMTLLRATKSPDPVADLGEHRFAFAVMPHAGGWREAGVVAEAFRFNAPVLFAGAGAGGGAGVRSFASTDDPNVVIDTVKLAEDSDAVVVRLYETHGGRGVARVTVDLPFKTAVACNVLEEEAEAMAVGDGGTIEVPYGPYKVIGIKLK